MAAIARVTGLLFRAPVRSMGATWSRPAATGVVAAVVAVVVSVASTQLALLMPSDEWLPRLAAPRAIEGSTHVPGSFSALRAGFVARALGLESQATPVADGARRTGAASPASFGGEDAIG